MNYAVTIDVPQMDEGLKFYRDALGLAEVENAAFPSGTKDSENLPQTCVVVGEIAESEGGSHEVELIAGEREIECVGFDPHRRRI